MKAVQRVLPNFKKLDKAKWTIALIKTRLAGLHDIFREYRDLDVTLSLAATEVQ